MRLSLQIVATTSVFMRNRCDCPRGQLLLRDTAFGGAFEVVLDAGESAGSMWLVLARGSLFAQWFL